MPAVYVAPRLAETGDSKRLIKLLQVARKRPVMASYNRAARAIKRGGKTAQTPRPSVGTGRAGLGCARLLGGQQSGTGREQPRSGPLSAPLCSAPPAAAPALSAAPRPGRWKPPPPPPPPRSSPVPSPRGSAPPLAAARSQLTGAAPCLLGRRRPPARPALEGPRAASRAGPGSAAGTAAVPRGSSRRCEAEAGPGPRARPAASDSPPPGRAERLQRRPWERERRRRRSWRWPRCWRPAAAARRVSAGGERGAPGRRGAGLRPRTARGEAAPERYPLNLCAAGQGRASRRAARPPARGGGARSAPAGGGDGGRFG